MQGTYNMALVALSYVVAVVASFTALELSRRVSRSNGPTNSWLFAGAVSMGIGIWTMHFIGMLAFTLPMKFSFEIWTTLFSLLVGVAASAFAIFVASRKKNSFLKIFLSGLLLGAGISAMHYTGMAAMEMNAVIIYDRKLVALSIAIAVAAACAALWIMFALIDKRSRYLIWMKIGAALVMGIAICGMHYTGMAAADYVMSPGAVMSGESGDHAWLATAVATMALFILGITHLTIFFDRRLSIEQHHSKKAEQEKIQINDVLDESSNEFYFCDSESHRFVKVNRGALVNLGYSMEEFMAMTPLDISPELDVASLNKLLRPLRDGTANQQLFDTCHRRKDGTDYPVQVHLQLSERTDPPIFVAVVTDITQRKNLESQLIQAQKMQSIGQLAAGVAHEINTPAQFVGDNIRFVQDALEDLMTLGKTYQTLYEATQEESVTAELVDEVGKAIKVVDLEFLTTEVPSALEQSLDGISRISNIVRALKEYSHPGGQDFEAVDLNSTITNTITLASSEWKYIADMETDFAEDLPPVMCFQQEINQVVLNLIVNAAHAIEAGDGAQPKAKGKIRIATRATDTFAEISIADSGCGMPEEIRERIFEPFFTTKEVGKGSGQGLAMAYSTVVKRHKGKLLVNSEQGKGTTFTIRLPLDRPDSIFEEDAA